MDNVRRIYILINRLGLKRFKNCTAETKGVGVGGHCSNLLLKVMSLQQMTIFLALIILNFAFVTILPYMFGKYFITQSRFGQLLYFKTLN